jgi:hypothetical protein
MADVLKLLWAFFEDYFRSPEQMRAENAVLRHQLNILQRRILKKPHMTGRDRTLFVWLYRLFPKITGAITIIRPETVIGWHRAGFRTWWRWKSRNLGGRPKSTANCAISSGRCAMRIHFGVPRAFMANC